MFNDRFALPLLVLLICGAVSVGLDLDHVPVLLAKGLPITLDNLATQAGRPLHLPAVVVSGVVFLIAIARHFRLLSRMERHECD